MRLDPPPEHWCGAFRQAWAAYGASTIPVGAVVVDPHGVIAAEASNRIFDVGDPPRGQLARSWLAHAKLNAVAQIDAERTGMPEGWAVYSTWEPRPLCAGAITVAFRGRIRVGSRVATNQQRAARADGHSIGRRRQWQIEQLPWAFAVFAESLLAVYTTEALRGALPLCAITSHPGDTSSRPPAPSSPGGDRGQTVKQVVATIWAAIEQAEVGTATTRPRSAVSHPAGRQVETLADSDDHGPGQAFTPDLRCGHYDAAFPALG